MGNPNSSLAFMGSLIDGARAWRFFIASYTEARLCMPLRTPNLLMILGFCQWYRTSNSTPTGFSINSSGVMLISQRLKRKVTEKSEGKRSAFQASGSSLLLMIVRRRTQKVLALKGIQVLKLQQLFLVG